MSEKKRSLFRWIRPPRFLKRYKKRDLQPLDESAKVQPNRVEPTAHPNNADLTKMETTYAQLQKPVLPPIQRNLPTDDFDLFIHISNSPTSATLPTLPRDPGRKRSPDTTHETQGRKLHFSPSMQQQQQPRRDDSSRASLISEDLRRAMSMIERKPSVPKPTSFRRDLARASFRSKSVRERGIAKKLHNPWPIESQDENDYHGHSGCPNRLLEPDGVNDMDHAYESNLCRVRSFKLTRKGVVNLGDTFRASSVVGLTSNQTETHPLGEVHYSHRPSSAGHSIHSPGFASAADEFTFQNPDYPLSRDRYTPSRRSTLRNEPDQVPRGCPNGTHDQEFEQPIRIQVVGSPNVGKTALCRQMITSEFLGARMESISEDTVERYVTVELDEQTWNIVLIDNFGEAGADELALVNTIKSQEKSGSGTDSPSMIQSTLHLLPHSKSSGSTLLKDVLVYLLVFAVDDARSYDYASKVLKLLSKASSDRIIMLVGNKADLVRRRIVSQEKGKRLAHLYGCKYFEVSTAINHLVDELLVGIILQIKRVQQRRTSPHRLEVPNATERRMSSLRLHGEAIVRYFRDKFDTKSCEDIQHP